MRRKFIAAVICIPTRRAPKAIWSTSIKISARLSKKPRPTKPPRAKSAKATAWNKTADHAAKVLKGRDVKALLTGAGIEPMPSLADWTDKHCRDTCLSWLALAGADDFEIAGFSGHAFGEDKRILKHYVAVPPEFARRGMVKLEAWYAAQCGALENASGTESLT